MTNTLLEESPQPSVPTHSEAATQQINLLPWSAPFSWLKLGWRDIAAHPLASLFYGLPFWCMALVLNAVFAFEPEYAMMAVSVCLLLGPFAAMGLYDASRRREQGLASDFMGSLTCWKQHLRSTGMLAGVLLVLALLWGRAIMPSDFDANTAAITSLEVVGVSVLLPMAVGLAVVGPLLGHASWHA